MLYRSIVIDRWLAFLLPPQQRVNRTPQQRRQPYEEVEARHALPCLDVIERTRRDVDLVGCLAWPYSQLKASCSYALTNGGVDGLFHDARILARPSSIHF